MEAGMNLTIYRKILALGCTPIAIFIAVFYAYVLPSFGGRYMEARKLGARQVVEMAYTYLQAQDARVKAGELPLAQAQKEATAALMKMRYGGDNYAWIAAPGPKMIAHPIKPELDGKDLGDTKDGNGFRHFAAMDVAARNSEGGYVAYTQVMPDKRLRPKISYIRRFDPWSWDLATGVYVDDVQATLRSAGLWMGLPLLILVGLVIWVSLRMARAISVPIQTLATGLQDSDLTLRLPEQGSDEIAGVAKAFNTYNTHLHGSIQGFVGYSERVAAGSTELAASSEEMARAVGQIADVSETIRVSGERISGAMEELKARVEDVNDHLRRSDQEIQLTVDSTAQSTRSGEEASRGIAEIREAAQQIVKAVSVIQEIARQTNLLSLNAAIEAAKAGSMGKGFAVVAEEVRKLADRSRSAAGEIGVLAQRTEAAVETGVQGVKATLDSLEDIRQRIASLAGQFKGIDAAVRAQSEASLGVDQQIHDNHARLEQNAAATHELSATVHEITRTAGDLAEVADGLRTAAGRFRL
jgi:methyl-accepting chemotaxis protein